MTCKCTHNVRVPGMSMPFFRPCTRNADVRSKVQKCAQHDDALKPKRVKVETEAQKQKRLQWHARFHLKNQALKAGPAK